jgi:hypothetical protein
MKHLDRLLQFFSFFNPNSQAQRALADHQLNCYCDACNHFSLETQLAIVRGRQQWL